MKKGFSLCSLLAAVCLLSAAPSEACTGLKVKAKDGNTVRGRTFEFGVKVDNSVVVIPRGYAFVGTTPKGEGLAYNAKYGVVGTMCFDLPLVMDGMNEKGLSVGTFYFPGFAGYAKTTPGNQDRSLSSIDFPNWLLTQFATLDEVKAGVKKVYIAPTIIKNWGETDPPPFHYVVYDKAGNSLVIEPINGQLVVSDNPLGVFTNSPTFEWQMTNLRNFINLSPQNASPVKVEGIVLSPFGQGSGMVGLPGDFTPPSRFVRAAIYSMTAEPSTDTPEAIAQAFHLLNQFDIPVGAARSLIDGKVYADYTLATVVHDPKNLKYYFKTFEDQTVKVVALKAFDLKAQEIKKMDTAGQQTYVDVSHDLQAMGS